MALPSERRPRKVHKLQLADVQGLSPEDLVEMLREGPVEIIVAVEDSGAWGETLGRFFHKMETDVEQWRHKMRNRTVIVNFVDRG